MAYLPFTRLLGVLKSVDLNSTSDQAITIATRGATRYVIRNITITNVSTTLAVSLAAGGIYTGASKSGTTIVAAGQVYTALTGSTKLTDLTLTLTADTLTALTLYFSLTVAHGVAATADVYIFGDLL